MNHTPLMNHGAEGDMGHDDVVYGSPRTGRRSSCVPLLAGGISLLAACAPLTVAPIVEAGEAVDVPGIAGRWVGEEGDTTTVTAVRAGEYTLSFSDKNERATRFQARLGRLGDRLVMDVYAQLEKNEAAGLTETLLGTVIPGHLLVVLELQGDRMRAAMLSEDSLKSALRTGVLRTPSLDLDGTVVLTAPHDSLRAALAKYLDRPGVLGEWGEATRVAPAAPAPRPRYP
jgi:hypothetical protein